MHNCRRREKSQLTKEYDKTAKHKPTSEDVFALDNTEQQWHIQPIT